MTLEPPLEHPDEPLDPEETYRVLFLDTPAHVELLKATCKEYGYVVVGAETIPQAMAFLEGKDHVDVIVCAPHLETDSMFSFLLAVRADPRHRGSTFLILSLEPGVLGARLDRTTARAGMALGADAYLIMPTFDPEALIAQIRELQPAIPLLQQCSPTERLRSS